MHNKESESCFSTNLIVEYVWLIILFNCLRKLIVLAHLLKFLIHGSFSLFAERGRTFWH